MTELSRCKQCGEPLDPRKAVGGVLKCDICGAIRTFPKSDSAALAFLRQGEHDLDACDFEKAYTAYQKAAELDQNEPEAYFGMALSAFRVQYLKDEVNHHLQPICHEISEKVFTEDKNYKKALELATLDQKKVYRAKGGEIDDIRDEFFALKKSGLDYDCFLCAKVTAEDGSRTAEYDWTSALYDELKDKGYSPFFSERKLKDETGNDYEAHILYALYTSECMLIVCSNEEYLHTKWVKNEYTRFLSMIANEEKERDAVTFVFRGKPIEKLPGRNGKLQGIDLANPNAYARIAEYVEKHTPEARARREEEARKKQEAEAARDRALEEMQEQLRQLREGNQPTETEQTAIEEDARDRELKELKEQLKQLLEANQKAEAERKAAGAAERNQREIKQKPRPNLNYPTLDNYNKMDFEIEGTVLRKFKSRSFKGEVKIPRGVTEISWKAFYGCTNLTSIVIPEGVTSIGEYAFFGCTKLKSIVLSKRLTLIGDSAFSGCKNLINLIIPQRVTSIGKDAFKDCTNLTSIILPERLTSIGEWAFFGCKNLTSVVIPKSVKQIENNPFSNCPALEKLEVEQGNPVYHSDANCIIETVSGTLIVGCKNSIILRGGSVTSIGREAFFGCINLKSIIIPMGVTSIGEEAFSLCRSLTSIFIPNGVTKISGVTKIGGNAFSSCPKLTIYCEDRQQPRGWDEGWNPDNRPVVWGAKACSVRR